MSDIPVFNVVISPNLFPKTQEALMALLDISGDEAKTHCEANGLPGEVAATIHQALLMVCKRGIEDGIEALSEILAPRVDVFHMQRDADGTVSLIDHQPRIEEGEDIGAHKRSAELN